MSERRRSQHWSAPGGEQVKVEHALDDPQVYIDALQRQRLGVYVKTPEWPADTPFSIEEAEKIVGAPCLLRHSVSNPRELMNAEYTWTDDDGHEHTDQVGNFLGYEYEPIVTDTFTLGGQTDYLTLAERQHGDGDAETTFMTDEHGNVEQMPHYQIVIKTISVQPQQRARREMALREIAALSKKYRGLLDAKRIIEENGRETFVLALEQIPGIDLRQLWKERGKVLGQNPYSPKETLGLMMGTLATVRELKRAKAMGLTHRDIKPGNVVLNVHDPKKSGLCDWGLAGYTPEAVAGDGLKNADRESIDMIEDNGFFMGTPLYMSQKLMDGDDDPNADGCGLGLTMLHVMGVPRQMFRGTDRALRTAIDIGRRMDIPKLTAENHQEKLGYWSPSPLDRRFAYLMARLGQPTAKIEEYNPRPFDGGYDELEEELVELIALKEKEVAEMGQEANVVPQVRQSRGTTPGVRVLRPISPKEPTVPVRGARRRRSTSEGNSDDPTVPIRREDSDD